MKHDPYLDRRSSVRLRLPLTLRLQPLAPGGSDQNPRGWMLSVALHSLSQGGVSFVAPQELSAGRRYEVEILHGQEPVLHGTLRILWIQPASHGGFLHGAYFSQIVKSAFDEMDSCLKLPGQEIVPQPATDRRAAHRRTGTSTPLAASLDRRRIEQRHGVRVQRFRTARETFLSEELRKILLRRVVITGVGVITPIGCTKEAFAQALHEGRSGIRPITRFPSDQFTCQVAGEVDDKDFKDLVDPKQIKRMDRATLLGVAAATQAVRDAGLQLNRENLMRVGVAMGTTVGGLERALSEDDVFERKGMKAMHPYSIAAASPNACSGELAALFQLRGVCSTFSQGCSSAAAAIAFGHGHVQQGGADVVLAGGCEAPLFPSLHAGFCRAGLLANQKGGNLINVPHPFSKTRDGTVLAEGAAVLVLEELEHAMSRSAHIYAEVLAISNTCDGYEMIQPRTDAGEATRAIREAIDAAGLSPSEISVIFTHAPGTKEADAVELRALRRVFGASLTRIPLANVKSITGYTQGACVAIECAAACFGIEQRFVPPVLHADTPEDGLRLPRQAMLQPLQNVLVNCFGFGGKNMCIILTKADEDMGGAK